jgi:hypothetical protein
MPSRFPGMNPYLEHPALLKFYHLKISNLWWVVFSFPLVAAIQLFPNWLGIGINRYD